MRIARFANGDGVAYGVVEGEPARGGSATAPGLTIAELYGHPFGVDPGGVRLTGRRYPLAEVRLLAPVLPSKVVGADRNYASQLREANGESAAEPVLFLKPSTSVTGPGDAIKYPVKVTERVDFEGELAVIIGRALPAGAQGAGRGGHLRLYLRQRCHLAGPAGPGRAVDPGQGV